MPTELKVRALPNNILVKPIRRERTTPGGLIVPYQVDERPQEGEVISVGEDIYLDCSIGDIVLYLKLGVDRAGDADRDLLSIPRRWIMGVLKDRNDYMSIQPFNRIVVQMIPIEDDYKMMFGMKSDLTIMTKKIHWEPTFRRAIVKALDDSQSNDGDVAVGDTIYMRGDAGITLDGEDVEDQPLYGLRYRWIKFKEVLAKQEDI